MTCSQTKPDSFGTNKRKIQRSLVKKLKQRHTIVGFLGPDYKSYHNNSLRFFKKVYLYEKDIKNLRQFNGNRFKLSQHIRFENLTIESLSEIDLSNPILFDFDFCSTIKNNVYFVHRFFKFYNQQSSDFKEKTKFVFTFSLRQCSYLDTIALFEEKGGWFLTVLEYRDTQSMLILTNILV